MNEKISINVEILGINSTNNFVVHSDMSVSKLIELMVKLFEEEYTGTSYSNRTNYMLMQSKSGKILNSDFDIEHLGIASGEKLILL